MVWFWPLKGEVGSGVIGSSQLISVCGQVYSILRLPLLASQSHPTLATFGLADLLLGRVAHLLPLHLVSECVYPSPGCLWGVCWQNLAPTVAFFSGVKGANWE